MCSPCLPRNAFRAACGLGMLAALLPCAGPVPLVAQAPPHEEAAQEQQAEGQEVAAERAREGDPAADASGWNSARALDLADRAILARGRGQTDTSLQTFRARAEGHVYFLGEFADARQVVRADQVALELLWQAPDRALQTIVGRRHEKRLPSRVRYHIDHLAVVLDNYGDLIRIGDGDEVKDVLHPAAPGALRRYDYRLADSLEIQVRDRVTRVYRLQVRPTDPDDAGLVGSVFVDRESGAIARLRGTFTVSSYVDPQLDYVSVDLRSGLWDGRWWLPAEQVVEVRREVQWLDMPVGGVIRTEMRVLGYEINVELPYRLAEGERIASLSAPRLADFDEWRSGLYDGAVEARERTPHGLREMMAEARELVGRSALESVTPFRAYLPDPSAAFRVRRAEGLLLGWGGTLQVADGTALSAWAGWPFARERPQAELGLAQRTGPAWVRLRLVADRLADVGPFVAAPGLISTVGTAVDGEDWMDPFYESGGELGVTAPLAGGQASLTVQALRHRSAELVAGPVGGGSARAVRPVDDGTLTAFSGGFTRRVGPVAGARWTVGLRGEAGVDGPGDFGFTRLLATLSADGERPESAWGWGARLSAGVAGGELPRQRLFLLGGRGTLPGQPFRDWAGDRLALLEAQVSREIAHPWLTARALGVAGWTELAGAGVAAAERFEVGDTGPVRASVGVGAGLFYDILRLELYRGLGDRRRWELVVSISPALQRMM